ncbi:flavin-nucleotide-binding protein [Mycolicibacterium aromaticivorans JS19b1 = JCM 16368]|uniref:Flavin-nucleotide-binding protein n=1 Tax=Mycolicibacterium aromaticivorans JS19b1 = JCM 16368 TaxID=1440774 RepID=A0A064CQZ6_9MYCO|nr:pyridoxamine 5'-phosphate oxidase family protein [Mycolicibacterium aromaticivorans]KDF01149.1 flavin-nucleotide-binding protein [Mycolicibacterium aromaticivorans JS19b1 = JCM 16368]
MPQPSTSVSRLPEKQNTERSRLDELLDVTPLATVALVRDGHPVIFPIGFARIGDELVIHGSTGSPWLRQLADGAAAAVSVTALDGVLVARSGFESSFQFRSATLFGTFDTIEESDKIRYLETLTDTFIPGRVAELRASSRKELAATLALRMEITDDNWSLKIGDGWPEDSEEDVAAGAWAGVVPLTTVYGEPRRAPDCDPATPVPPSVRAMSGELSNRRGRQFR